MDFFSDREQGKKPQTLTNITVDVWNGIILTIEGLIANNALSKSFPAICPDNGQICGCDKSLLRDGHKAIIPDLGELTRKSAFTQLPGDDDEFGYGQGISVPTIINTYAVLDLIEFIYRSISDAHKEGEYHDYFSHYHLSFNDNTTQNKTAFRNQINQLFERNRIAYKLESSGIITRIVSEEFLPLVHRKFATRDSKLNDLLTVAVQHILLPKPIDRIRALEKVWDAFERMKTFYEGDKKMSVEQIIELTSSRNQLFKTCLIEEFRNLTKIGNEFQIRHFENGKQEITDSNHIDYLFFRMMALINLVITELEKEK